MAAFTFLEPGLLVDGDLILSLISTSEADPAKGYVPQYIFEMRQTQTHEKLGGIRLRAGDSWSIHFGGHIGYEVEPEQRGHRYAARAVRLLLPFAQQHGMAEVWITCSPSNPASRRTAELAGGEFVEVVPLPEDHALYLRGEREVCRYCIKMKR